jgi:hypothetical protein
MHLRIKWHANVQNSYCNKAAYQALNSLHLTGWTLVSTLASPINMERLSGQATVCTIKNLYLWSWSNQKTIQKLILNEHWANNHSSLANLFTNEQWTQICHSTERDLKSTSSLSFQSTTSSMSQEFFSVEIWWARRCKLLNLNRWRVELGLLSDTSLIFIWVLHAWLGQRFSTNKDLTDHRAKGNWGHAVSQKCWHTNRAQSVNLTHT